MSMLRDVFERQASGAGLPDLDIDELVGGGERRLRRRRLAAATGAAAAVAAVAICITALSGTGTPRPAPVDSPAPGEAQTNSRPIVYSDDRSGTIHLGDRKVETSGSVLHLDVTDDGVVYTTGSYTDEDRIWFSDGGAPERIGSHACVALHGFPFTVATGSSGSLAAWFDCTRERRAELVVFDTGTGREVMRRRVPGCVSFPVGRMWSSGCYPAAVIGDHVYIDRDKVLITPDGEEAGRAFVRDFRSDSRGMVIGESWTAGTPTLHPEFDVAGRRLIPSTDGPRTSAFDNATRRLVRLHLPDGYEVGHDAQGGDGFGRLQWLDDDTIALVGDGRQEGDILTCRLSSGHCDVVLRGIGDGRNFPY